MQRREARLDGEEQKNLNTNIMLLDGWNDSVEEGQLFGLLKCDPLLLEAWRGGN